MADDLKDLLTSGPVWHHKERHWLTSSLAQDVGHVTFVVQARSYIYTRISDLAVVPYRQNQSPRLDFRGSDEGPPPRRVTPCG